MPVSGRGRSEIRADRHGLTVVAESLRFAGMIAMAPVEDDWISVAAAADLAGCSQQYIRKELLQHVEGDDLRTTGGRLEGWRPNGKAWLVSRRSVLELAGTLTTRAKKNADKRTTAKKSRKK